VSSEKSPPELEGELERLQITHLFVLCLESLEIKPPMFKVITFITNLRMPYPALTWHRGLGGEMVSK